MTDKIVLNSGVKIHYRIIGNGKRPIVMLHGGGGSLSAWDLMIPYFKDKDLKLITVDLRGHGKSDRPGKVEDYILEKHAEDVLKVLQAEKIKKADIIGHCMGSMVGVTFASKNPAMVDKLVLINGSYDLPWFIKNSVIKSIVSLLDFIFDLFPQSSRKVTERVNYVKYQGSHDLSIKRLWADLKVMSPYSATKQFLAVLKWDGKKYFNKLHFPILLIAGKNDLLYPPGKVLNAVKFLRNYELYFINSNHISNINNPGDVYAKISEFLGL